MEWDADCQMFPLSLLCVFLIGRVEEGQTGGGWEGSEEQRWRGRRWNGGEEGGGEGGKEQEMPSHVSPGRMLLAPLLIFNEARRNIMQMSLNGAWTTAPRQGHRSLHLPLPPLHLTICPPSFSVLLIVENGLCPRPPHPSSFLNFLPNAFPILPNLPSTHPRVRLPGSSSHRPILLFQRARLCHRSPLQTRWLIRRLIGPS